MGQQTCTARIIMAYTGSASRRPGDAQAVIPTGPEPRCRANRHKVCLDRLLAYYSSSIYRS